MCKLNLDFGIYNIDLRRILRFLKQDMTDDWFKDPLLFEDRLNHEEIQNYFYWNIDKNNGIYVPSKRILLNIPKEQGTLRYALETNIYDRIAFHAFGTTLIEHIDPLLSTRVFSHRLNKKEFKKNNPRYLYYNSIVQWQKFDEFVRIDSQNSTILFTDIQNYYEHINLNILKSILFDKLKKLNINGRNKSRVRFCIDSICKCLEEWAFDENGGLPQNRDISSFLANVYMDPIDQFMINDGYDYYRYMDDIRIICKDKFHARKAMKSMSHELRKIHLTLNASKTEILEPNSPKHKNYILNDCIKLERINSMFKTKKKQIVALAFKEVKEGIEQCVKNNEFDSRQFRFYLGRISKIALCNEIRKPLDYYDKIKKKILKSIVSFPRNTDAYYNLLVSIDLSINELRKISKFLMDEGKAIYSWQNYLLWKVLIHHEYKNRNLLKHARSLIASDHKAASKMGALLYIGSCGDKNDKNEVIKHFGSYSDFMSQRHALIALQELDYSDVINISEHITMENNNTYKVLHTRGKAKYITSPESVSINDLFNQVGFYA